MINMVSRKLYCLGRGDPVRRHGGILTTTRACANAGYDIRMSRCMLTCFSQLQQASNWFLGLIKALATRVNLCYEAFLTFGFTESEALPIGSISVSAKEFAASCCLKENLLVSCSWQLSSARSTSVLA
jgi:hypothetical protein